MLSMKLAPHLPAQKPNHSVNSDAQLGCASLGAGYVGRWADKKRLRAR